MLLLLFVARAALLQRTTVETLPMTPEISLLALAIVAMWFAAFQERSPLVQA